VLIFRAVRLFARSGSGPSYDRFAELNPTLLICPLQGPSRRRIGGFGGLIAFTLPIQFPVPFSHVRGPVKIILAMKNNQTVNSIIRTAMAATRFCRLVLEANFLKSFRYPL
jgi:hypothetical protein